MTKPTIKPALFNHYQRAAEKGTDQVPRPFDPANLSSSPGLSESAAGTKLEGTPAADLIVAAGLQRELLGNAGDDLIFGTSQDDRIVGGPGADIMAGLQGNDTYLVDSTADRVLEREGEGTDTIGTLVGYTLPGHVENLYAISSLIQDDGALVGNALDNQITGGAFSYETILGLDGNDTLDGGGRTGGLLDGGPGDDMLIQSFGQSIGGSGADTFVAAGRGAMTAPDTPIVIEDFNAADGDRIVIYASQDYSTSELLSSGALRFEAASQELVLDFDPTTTGEGSVDQVIVLPGIDSLEWASVSVVEPPV